MTARLILALAVALIPTLARADDGSKAGKPDPAALERRVADLEKQLTKLLADLQALRSELKQMAKADAPEEFQIFALKNADAVKLAKVLDEIFNSKAGKALRIVADEQTNSILVRGPADQMETVKAVIARLDESARK
jgi:type II secretory pathway component GspD/PulD (secretin)